MGEKCFDESWDFRTADTKILTHCFHPYPAMMIPQVSGRLLDKYGKGEGVLFDPYCGTGTSLVEANLRGLDALGTDLNPLARLIAKSKTTNVDLRELDLRLKDFSDITIKRRFGIAKAEEADVPSFMNIDYWFDKDVQKELAAIKIYIEKIDDDDIARFFKVAFSETVRECSWTRNGEFKLFRMTKKQMENFHPEPFTLMEAKLIRNRNGLGDFMKARKGNAISRICNFNTVDGIPEDILPPKSVNIIVTSPPYGDSRTTVAYGQFSRLANQWLGVENASKIDNLLMGGKRKKESVEFGSNTLRDVINEIAQKDEKRVQDVTSFYADYQKSIGNVAKVVRNGGRVCYVVGNRRVKGVTLPTDEITRQFFETNGFTHIETIIRNIPNKRMPSKNSPTNVVGELDITMSNEYIVILEKT